MSWLRLDDKFPRHPKISRLTRGDRWTWLEVLCYCAEYQTEGYVPDAIQQGVPKATGPFLERCYELGLLDVAQPVDNANYRVHDWAIYNAGTVQERVNAYLDDHPAASANEVQKAVGGARKLVLSAVRSWADTGTTEPTGVLLSGSRGGTKSVTRARSPSPKDKDKTRTNVRTSREDPNQPLPDWDTVLRDIPD